MAYFRKKSSGFMPKLLVWLTARREELYLLYLAVRDRRTPIYTKLILILTAGYVVSPIDLVSDLIPLAGYIDDLIILPLGLRLAFATIPAHILAECRHQADRRSLTRQLSIWTLAIILVLACMVIILWQLFKQ